MSWDDWRVTRRAKKRVAAVWREYEPRLAEANLHGGQEYDSLYEEACSQVRLDEALINSIRTRRWLRKAANAGVRVPAVNDPIMWQRDIRRDLFLTNDGVAEIRRAITKEREERLRLNTAFLREAAVPITGILGTLIGLAATLHACFSKRP